MPTDEPPLQPNPSAGARGLLRGERGSESVEFAVVALIVAIGWLVAEQWLQATIAECISAVAASIYELQA